MRLSSARSAFLAPKARAISRVPTLPERSRMKAKSSSREGRVFRLMDRSVAESVAKCSGPVWLTIRPLYHVEIIILLRKTQIQTGAFHLDPKAYIGSLRRATRAAVAPHETGNPAYSAACVDLRCVLPAGARLAAGVAGRLDEALMWRAVPGEGRFGVRGRARAVGPPRSERASISAAASSSVIVSGVLSLGSVALTPSWLA